MTARRPRHLSHLPLHSNQLHRRPPRSRPTWHRQVHNLLVPSRLLPNHRALSLLAHSRRVPEQAERLLKEPVSTHMCARSSWHRMVPTIFMWAAISRSTTGQRRTISSGCVRMGLSRRHSAKALTRSCSRSLSQQTAAMHCMLVDPLRSSTANRPLKWSDLPLTVFEMRPFRLVTSVKTPSVSGSLRSLKTAVGTSTRRVVSFVRPPLFRSPLQRTAVRPCDSILMAHPIRCIPPAPLWLAETLPLPGSGKLY